MADIDLNDTLPEWAQSNYHITRAANRRSGGSKKGSWVYKEFRTDVLMAKQAYGETPPVKLINELALKAMRLLKAK